MRRFVFMAISLKKSRDPIGGVNNCNGKLLQVAGLSAAVGLCGERMVAVSEKDGSIFVRELQNR